MCSNSPEKYWNDYFVLTQFIQEIALVLYLRKPRHSLMVNLWGRGWQTFPVKVPEGEYFRRDHQMVSFTSTLILLLHQKAVIENK